MEDIDFWVDFVAKNSNKLQKLGLEGKISWVCSHLGQHSTGYTSKKNTMKWKCTSRVRRIQWNEHLLQE